MPDLAAMRLTRRASSIAAALAVGIGVAVFVLVVASSNGGTRRPCSSYPTPGSLSPAGTRLPAALASRYSLFGDPQRAVDRLSAGQVASLKASGLIMSGTRFLGDAAFGGRISLVPPKHLLAGRTPPAQCLSAIQRVIEQESLPLLRHEYSQAALCLVVLYRSSRMQNVTDCAPATSTQYSLLSVTGTPGFGLVPNGVNAVTVSYWAAPPRTVQVDRNSFVIVAPSQAAPPCGVQWLDPTGNVKQIPLGCSFLTTERHELSEYRAYVAGKLATLRSQVTTLGTMIGTGSLARARAAWLSAHLTWLAIGQDDDAYGCFGALGGEIDGLAAGHPRGTADPAFTGFHRVEFDLWTRRDLRAAATDAAKLKGLLAQLMKVPLSSYLPATPTSVGNWLLRPHEVLEDALRDSLTADDDYGSGTDLASITADVAGVRVMLSELRPSLHLVAPQLGGDADAGLNALMGALAATRGPNRGWVAITDLPIRQRQQIDADVGATLEALSPIPDLLTSTGSNAPNG
jgi:hypothetical protein